MVLLTCPLLHFCFCSLEKKTVLCDLWKDVLNNEGKITRGRLQYAGELLRTEMRLVVGYCTCCRFLTAICAMAIKTKLMASLPYTYNFSFIVAEEQLLALSKLKG